VKGFEKLGLFYLGREVDPASGTATDVPLLYDSSDLVTHGVIMGMTGSGKTGLGIGVIEEAAIDGVPVLAIDPKGDLANLLLTFPDLAASDFAPWVDAADAARHNLTPDAFAAQQAERWKSGLAEWGQDGARISRLRAAADFRVYTPGSRAGVPLALLNSLSAPAAENEDDARIRITTTASSLLALAGLSTLKLR
jgi:DNA helicase HerA-like ATPase